MKSAAYFGKSIIFNNPGLSAHLIISGWDPYNGYQIYDINQTGFMSEDSDFALGGSGSIFVKGYVDANYRRDMSLEEAKDLITRSIEMAINRDNSSGGNIRFINITEEKIVREIHPYTNFGVK